MNLYKINIENKKDFLRTLGVESVGVEIIAKKMDTFYIFIKDLKTPAVNILKQDALSIGAELAVPSGVILCEKSHYDCLLIASKKHLEILSSKELAQPFGLKAVAKKLKEFLVDEKFPIRVMGIINANDDSFYEKSRYEAKSAIRAIEQMIDEGADIIDIGAVSSRPNSLPVTKEEELKRVQEICDTIKHFKLYEKTIFSIDSYTPSVVEYALNCGFGIVNDITGASDDEIIKLTKQYNAKICIMHMQGTPQNMQENPHYDDVIVEVSDFFEDRIGRCEAAGISKKDIILDVGIGFGKNLEHNIALISNLSHFKKFGCELLIGASRKSMIDKIIKTPLEDRLEGTLAIHLKALDNGANIIRCHDVKEHVRALKVYEAIQ
ncbi:Dihydropteroate synthase (DHPS) [Sulfurovum sp. enrichment culture clone C5]|uniref:dihydropteroate synthase n=1 Tax=Sulfurovum sp. enrichment culture clone C5 TaxID=497650 RepID=A0A0S4XMS9_9BACT|nr:Dihydropteroate synthase (DHPS) [Sulfurovum sp. enrichment culture clone C5]